MKRVLLPMVILLPMVAFPAQSATAEPLGRNVIIACAVGAGALAAGTSVGLVPALASGVLLTPFAEIVATNALIGCGIGAAGAISARLIGLLYDSAS